MRPIDADALELGKFIETRTDWHKGWNDALDAATTQAPTIDAVEVVHVRWDNNGYCTNCGNRCIGNEYEEWRTKYCPYCGAKMKGAVNLD